METEAKWKPTSKMTPVILSSWNSRPHVVSSVLNQSWSVWPIAYGGIDHVWLSRLHHETYRTFHFGLLDHLLWRSQHHPWCCHAVGMLKQPCGEPQLTSNGNLTKDCQPEQPSQAAPSFPIHRNWMLFSVPNRTEPTLLMIVTLIMHPYICFSPFPVSRSHS